MSGYSRNLLSYRGQAIRVLLWSLGLFLAFHGIVGLLFVPLMTGPPLTLAPGQTVAMLPTWAQAELQAAPWFPRTLAFGVLVLLAAGFHAWDRGRKPLLVAADLCNGMIVCNRKVPEDAPQYLENRVTRPDGRLVIHARTYLEGECVSPGRYGDPESWESYERLRDEWLARNANRAPVGPGGLTVAELAERWHHQEKA